MKDALELAYERIDQLTQSNQALEYEVLELKKRFRAEVEAEDFIHDECSKCKKDIDGLRQELETVKEERDDYLERLRKLDGESLEVAP